MKLLEKHFLYTEVYTFLDFPILSLIIKQQIQRSTGAFSALLIIKSGFLSRVKHASFRILTSKHSAEVTAQCVVWFQGPAYFARGALYF